MSDFTSRLQDALGTAYRIERELPLGGLGRLFLALDVASGRQVSVQALPPDLAARVDLGRFRSAVDKVSRLRHPGILPLIAAGASDDIVYCVWAHPRGESLRYRLIRDGGLGGDETIEVLHDVADALDYGHGHGVAHGDLKPDNIYLEGGRALIAEFGIRSALNAALGTESGMDARADVHALAVAGQQMVAGRSGPASNVVTRALSIDPAEQFADAAAFREALGAPPSSQRLRRRWKTGIAVLGLAALALVAVLRSRGTGPLDANLLAVAPFDVLDNEHEVWREGLVTVLSANFDGAGPLHSVSPSIVVRRWEGRADAASAVDLGRRTGAKLALYGRIERAGGDSMRVSATLIDAEAGSSLAEMTLTDPRLDRLADSLTVRVLRELSRSRAIGAVRSASLGTGSLPALRAFLVGEQHYRRSEWDSAIASYQRAIELDSTFALALYRAGLAIAWKSNSGDPLSVEYLTRAAAHNRGLPTRDSMLIVAESLTAALDEGQDNPAFWRLYRRLYATTAEATRRYPRDAEVWYEYGEVRYHWPAFTSTHAMRSAFDRSIAFDSAFAPAYIHPVELALQMGDPAGARTYLDRYLALSPNDIVADAMRLTRRLLDPREARLPAMQAALDTASQDLLVAAILNIRGWADTLETRIRLGRLISTPRLNVVAPNDPALYVNELVSALAFNGHLREAWQRGGTAARVFPAMAWMGGVPRDSARARFARSLATEPLYPGGTAAAAAPWFAQQRDTVSLRVLTRRADSLERSGRRPIERSLGGYVAAGARAFTALARGDTATAIRGLLALADTACLSCSLYQIHLAQLLDARRMDEEAAVLLARDSPGTISPTDGYWELYRARLAIRRGSGREAVASYRFVASVWNNADPELQAFAREARAALARINERD